MTKTFFANDPKNNHVKKGNVYTIKDSNGKNIYAEIGNEESVNFLKKAIESKISSSKDGDTFDLISRGFV